MYAYAALMMWYAALMMWYAALMMWYAALNRRQPDDIPAHHRLAAAGAARGSLFALLLRLVGCRRFHLGSRCLRHHGMLMMWYGALMTWYGALMVRYVALMMWYIVLMMWYMLPRCWTPRTLFLLKAYARCSTRLWTKMMSQMNIHQRMHFLWRMY
jgi:hypothetical protein